MTEDQQGRSTDYPEDRAERRGEPQEGNAHDEEDCVEGFLRYDVFADLEWVGACLGHVNWGDEG